jgi:spermidine synthase
MLVSLFLFHSNLVDHNVLNQGRNFYGFYAVKESENKIGQLVRELVDGNTVHGSQLMDPEFRQLPTGYFRLDSGIGVSVNFLDRSEPLHMGVIGLGAGTIATYGDKGDTIRFYEINPAIEEIAEKYFYYLKQCLADCLVVLGDARISLERELKASGSQEFHILAVDAFSSDAIPVHLLTREAFALYWQHLRSDGILAVHISNNHLELSPLIRNLAKESGKQAVLITAAPDTFSSLGSKWVLISSNENFLGDDRLQERITNWASDNPEPILWTDDYSNLLSVLGKSAAIFHFRPPLR